MTIPQIESLTFAIHIILLGVKMWALFVVVGNITISKAPNNKKYMLVSAPHQVALLLFCALLVSSEAYFIYSFFKDLDLYYYEYLAMIDEIVFTLIAMNYLIKEGNNDKN